MSTLGSFAYTLRLRFSSFSPSLSDWISGDISASLFFFRMSGVDASPPPTLMRRDCAVISFWALVIPSSRFTSSICSISSRIIASLNFISHSSSSTFRFLASTPSSETRRCSCSVFLRDRVYSSISDVLLSVTISDADTWWYLSQRGSSLGKFPLRYANGLRLFRFR